MLTLRSARLFDGVTNQLHARPLVLVDQGRITDVDLTRADPPQGAALVDLVAGHGRPVLGSSGSLPGQAGASGS
jgi:hypothetical protein